MPLVKSVNSTQIELNWYTGSVGENTQTRNALRKNSHLSKNSKR